MAVVSGTEQAARKILIRGIVQGVGFRPSVLRLARDHGLAGWVRNGAAGVEIHLEGREHEIEAFIRELPANAPPAATIDSMAIEPDVFDALSLFEIRQSETGRQPTTRVAPDLVVCDACLRELFDQADRRFGHPYINCTDCGPRYSIVRALPYDRARTTMADWPLCPACADEYHNPGNRRFHAQPVACPQCGPGYRLVIGGQEAARDREAIDVTARLLCSGRIVAVKGIGGYHLACDAGNARAVADLRARKYRKEQPFALMVRDPAAAERSAVLSVEAAALLMSAARPIVLAPAQEELPGVAPENRDVGVMLPYAPLHHLLFAAGAPDRLVVTSGNRSSEPIAFRDDDAEARLRGLADAFLIGERPIARRVDDSVVRAGALGAMVLRRSRGLAPAAVAAFPAADPILAVGGDLKNAVTLVVDGQAYVSQHIGDLSHLEARHAFAEVICDFLAMYAVDPARLTVAHDRHPDYASTAHALELASCRTIAVQHHRAHVASVLAERGALDRRVIGVAFDGTGYGDDRTVWGGEFFAGSVGAGFTRVAHLRPAVLAGGDAAARHPIQAAAGFLAGLGEIPDLTSPPFSFTGRYEQARSVLQSGVRVVPTTSAGRLFDTVAALLGFTRPVTFEGQAAMWLEHRARGAAGDPADLPCTFTAQEIDWRDTLRAVIQARSRGTPVEIVARAFHRALGRAVADACLALAAGASADTIVLSGGVMQNDLLLSDIRSALHASRLHLWTNRAVPPNDGGVSLGQAALAATMDGRR